MKLTLADELMRCPKMGPDPRIDQAKRLHGRGWQLSDIAIHLGVSKVLVKQWVRADAARR